MRANWKDSKVPSEDMRKRAREWWINTEYPNERPTEHDVDDLATLLDEVRNGAFGDVQALLVQELPWEERARNVLALVTEHLTRPET